MRHIAALLLVFLSYTIAGYAQRTGPSGILTGTVKDKQTQEPIPSVSISLEGASLGTVTDIDGKFTIENIPPKSYNVRIKSIDYKEIMLNNIVITTGNAEILQVELEKNSINLDGVVIRSNPFSKSAETPLSLQSLSAQEIKSNPGGNFDISRVIQAFPGVGGTSGSVGGYRNDLIIRGGAPNENVYYLDGIEVPVINHFATQGSAGGPTGIVNTNFISEVNLYTSAFPAKYDNPLSGVLEMQQRSANPDKVQHNVRLSATELAYSVDGPIKKDKLTFLASARRSYLQLLFKLLDVPIQPSYWDFQYKVDYKINDKLSFYTLGIGAIDNFSFLVPQELTPENVYILKGNPTINQWNYTNGYGLKGLVKNGYWNLTFSRNMLDNELNRFEDNQNPVESERILKVKSQQAENRTRFVWNKYFDHWSYSFGVVGQFCEFSNDYYTRVRSEIKDANGNVVQPAFAVQGNTSLNFFRYGAFAQAAVKLFKERMTVSAGLRTDGNTFTSNGNNLGKTISPRLTASVFVAENLKFNTSAARYYKIPTYTVLGFQSGGVYVNKGSDYIQSDHLVAGFEYLPARDTRFTLEGFYKQYSNYPVSLIDSISLANKGGDFNVLGNEPITSTGKGRSYGVEFQFQQKLTKNFFAILSYTYYFSEFTNADGVYKPASWDNRHLLSFIGGYKFKRNYELGVKFRYQGGAPYTPFDLAASQQNYLTTGSGIADNSQFNTLRLGAFHSMDIRLDKKWNFRKWALDVFVDVTNVYRSVQPQYPQYTFQRTPDNTAFATTDGQPVQMDGSNAIPYIIKQGDPVSIPTIGFILAF
ncbi:MAG: TonB-dependent receptor [Chitinophagaceae bacterium]|nr:TonB-dependent receptor [Chitinophagaceae bacterium]MCB9044876.1 TonB-dependent receptor [Chitinophagales bacterium]